MSAALGERPTASRRRALAARANRLKARLRVGQKGVTEALVEELRRMFTTDDLIKVRIDAEDRDEVRQVAAELCERVPCHLIQRVGRVVIVYHRGAETTS